MNTEDLEKLYKKNQNDTAPDLWDRIDSGLKPHRELNDEEKNAFAQFENLPADVPEITPENPAADATEHLTEKRSSANAEAGKIISVQKAKRRPVGGWIAAAAILAVCIPAALLAQRAGGKRSSLAVADTEVITEAAAEVKIEEAVTTAACPETAAGNISVVSEFDASLPETPADAGGDLTEAYEFYESSMNCAAPESGTSAAVLLSIPENAVTKAADTVYFTEEVLADTDMLAIVEISSAEFEYNKEGRAYRLCYTGTVKESLLDDSESGSAGSSIRIISPIVSSGAPSGEVLYQLMPGQTCILPLKKSCGDWELVCPYAPQIELHADGSFEFHTGYSSLLNEDTEVVFDTGVSDDDFWFDRRVSRSDEAFLDELTELIRFEKKKENPKNY